VSAEVCASSTMDPHPLPLPYSTPSALPSPSLHPPPPSTLPLPTPHPRPSSLHGSSYFQACQPWTLKPVAGQDTNPRLHVIMYNTLEALRVAGERS
jgi:hypothetical protein